MDEVLIFEYGYVPPPSSPRGVDRRNIAIIGAPDSGKSTVVDRVEHHARVERDGDVGSPR